MKVLVVGHEPTDFVCPIFRDLKEKYGYEIDLFETRGIERTKPCAKQAFDHQHDISIGMKSYSKAFIAGAVLTPYFVQTLVKTRSANEAVRKAVLYKRLKDVIPQYDIVHIFFLTDELFLFVDALKKAKKLVISFWGSDIFQNNHDFDYDKQKVLVRRADAITVHHKEMKLIFLSKFGRELNGKVKEVLVVSSADSLEKFIKAIPQKQELISSFKARYNIPEDKRVVAIGHCGERYDNHYDTVRVIGTMERKWIDKTCLVFPMTYGYDEDYAREVECLCNEIGVQSVFLTSYLSLEELVELRLASEVMLRISELDAFSLALTESLCAHNVVVSSSWLPYSKFRANGVYYEEVYDIEDVGEKLTRILKDYNSYAERCINNSANVVKVFNKERSEEKLKQVYTGLVPERA